MTPIVVSAIVFACMLLGLLGGMWLSVKLPTHHLGAESKSTIQVGMGLIATMTALVLGLMTASAKSEYDIQDTAVKHSATDILMLDRMLARCGTETRQIRDLLREALASWIKATWPEDGSAPKESDDFERIRALEHIEDKIRNLTLETADHRWCQARAQEITGDLLATRWLMFGSRTSAIPLPFLVVLIFWLTALFGTFGLFSPRNATVLVVLLVCAVSVVVSILLILEMQQPLEGMMKISGAPLEETLARLNQ